jgi:hypothetical protein
MKHILLGFAGAVCALLFILAGFGAAELGYRVWQAHVQACQR